MSEKKFFIICLFVTATLVFAFLPLFLRDISTYPISPRKLDENMANRQVVSFADIQGSRVYIVYEDGKHLAYTYEVSFFTNRFRFLWNQNLGDSNRMSLLGRTGRFEVNVSDGLYFEYTRVPVYPGILGGRLFLLNILSFLVLGWGFTYLMNKTFLMD